MGKGKGENGKGHRDKAKWKRDWENLKGKREWGKR